MSEVIPPKVKEYYANRERNRNHLDADKGAMGSQVGGGHYKDMVIQPVEFCQLNRLNFCEANIVKYAVRHRHKNGREDIEKVIHYAQLLLQMEYPEE